MLKPGEGSGTICFLENMYHVITLGFPLTKGWDVLSTISVGLQACVAQRGESNRKVSRAHVLFRGVSSEEMPYTRGKDALTI